MGQGRIILGFVFPIHEWKTSLLKPDHISFVYPPHISFDPLFMLPRFLVFLVSLKSFTSILEQLS